MQLRQEGLEEGPAELAEWWQRFEDPILDELVDQAIGANLELREALQRITAARAVYGIVAADRVPTIDFGGTARRDQITEEGTIGSNGLRTTETFRAGLDAAWEIDLWGRVRRSVEAAGADIDVTVEDARDLLVSVLSETALSYLDLRTAQERIKIAQSNVELQAATLKLTEDRFAAGIVSELDVAQARSILESTRSTLAPLAGTARLARNRLAILQGQAPGALEAVLAESGPIPVLEAEVAVGLPADLARRRPDIRRAERALAAQTARIGVAEAELYPQLTLFGSFGVSADNPGDLWQGSAVEFGFGPGVTWNVFDRTRLLGNVAAVTAATEQALNRYQNTVLIALDEVESAMTSFVQEHGRRRALAAAVEASRRAVELSREQYRQGLVSFQSVLDTQLRLFELEDDLALNQAAISTNLILLYKALGGGWESRDIRLAPVGANESGGED